MSDPVAPVSSAEQAQAASAPSEAGSSHSPTAKTDMRTRVSSLEELRTKAPEVWNQMLVSLAQTICGEMQRHSDRLKKLIREGQSE